MLTDTDGNDEIQSPYRLLSWASAGNPSLRVVLNIYHLGQNMFTRGLNALTRNGAYHSGVEISGKEWSYGMTFNDYSTGVMWNIPQMHPDHTFSEAFFMGTTKFSNGEVYLMLEELKRRWLGCRYNVLTRNCHHFSTEFCSLLGVKQPPDWMNKLATQGNAVTTALDADSAEYDGGDAFFDFVSQFLPAIQNFFTLPDDDNADNDRASPRLKPPLRHANSWWSCIERNNHQDPSASKSMFTRANGNSSPKRSNEWQNKWHDRRKRFEEDDDHQYMDELDILAYNARSSSSAPKSGLRDEDDVPDKRTFDNYESLVTSPSTSRINRKSTIHVSEPVDFLWPSPKRRQKRSTSDDALEWRRDKVETNGKVRSNGKAYNASDVRSQRSLSAPKESRSHWWDIG